MWFKNMTKSSESGNIHKRALHLDLGLEYLGLVEVFADVSV